MLEKKDILQLLRDREIPCTVTEHPAAFTMEEMDAVELPYRDTVAKNMFLHDERKRRFFLLSVREDRQVDLKAVRKMVGVHNLSFVSETDLMAILGLRKGSVTPFGILNDADRVVEMCFDAAFRDTDISVHPNENTATVCLATGELEKLLREHGNTVQYLDFERKNG